MELAAIQLAGFKSFVDPIKIVFPNRLTAIVGPNGCGKSNVIDAVRWVMGESSARNLRGESMDDVIFNGSVERSPVGQASVELQFNNCLGKLSGEYANYHEIAIKRVVNRDGQSQFFLNGARCRRKDITHIFLGTGLGPRSYSIIEQGMISRVIEAKPEELRAYLEEAAGISKYKERRRETENRIKHTQENLQRVVDILQELEQQLTKLQRQAKAAQHYKVLREQERLAKAQWQALRHQTLQTQLTQQQQQLQQHTVTQEEHQAGLTQLTTQMEQLQQQHTQQHDAWQNEQQKFYQLGHEITRLEQVIEHQQQRQQQLQHDIAQVEAELAIAKQDLVEDQHQVTQLTNLIDQITPHTQQQLQQVQQHEQVVADQEEALTDWQTQWETFQQLHARANETAQVAQTTIQHIEQRIEQLHTRIQALQTEQNQEQLTELSQAIETSQAQIDHHQQQHSNYLDQITQTKQQIQQQKHAHQQIHHQLDEVKRQRQTWHGEQTSLQLLQDAALGRQDEASQHWLVQHQLDHQQRLAEVIDVIPGWEVAVETVLGRDLQAICIDDVPTVAGWVEQMTHGQWQFIDPSQTSATDVTTATASPTLASQVKGLPIDVMVELDQVYLAEDLSTALRIRTELTPTQSVVTRQGLWLSTHWIRVNRAADDAAGGVLQRKVRLAELTEQLIVNQTQITQLQQQLTRGEQQLTDLEQQADTYQQQAQQANRRLTQAQAQLQIDQQRHQQVVQRSEKIQQELQTLQQQVDEQQQQLQQTRYKWQQALTALEQQADERQTRLDQQQTIKSKLSQARELSHEAREQYHQLQVQLQSAQSQRQGLQEHRQRAQQRIEQLQQRLQQWQQALTQVMDPDQQQQQQLQQQLGLKAVAEQQMNEAKNQLDRLAHQLTEYQQQHHDAEQALHSVVEQVQQCQLSMQEAKVRAATIHEAITEAGFCVATVVEQLPDGFTENECQQTIEQLERQIQRLGAINLAAIDECQTAAERHTYLTSQHQDLTEALTTLQQAIHKIDKETRERFKDTFDRVDQSFRQLFPQLFGGGQAYLQLTSDDLLDSGVNVIAQPPGKRNTSIHLLSGGEKAMTAVALVFAIFQLNPSPFCLLDEVDAPLDDANVARFCALVKQMSAQVQFIFITHNKVTMELADYLSGVTMRELGVSTIVSVDVSEAVALAEQQAA
ncbi:MAG: chromosome segregation protein SMC [Legionellales bacterium]|nr:chromosome segregation protein SMC [Legionellales bacterium]